MPMLRAELVGLDASTWFRSVLIDRGRNHGVHSGHAADLRAGPGRARHRDVAQRREGHAAARSAERGQRRGAAQPRSRRRARHRRRPRVRVRRPRCRRRARRRADHVGSRRRVSEGPAHRRRGERRGGERAAAARGERRSGGRLRPARAGVRDAAPRPDDGSALRDRGRRSARSAPRRRPAREARRSRCSRSCSRSRCSRARSRRSCPPAFRPDLALLVVFALSLVVAQHRHAVSCSPRCAASSSTCFSGALLGQHALLSRARVRGGARALACT